MKDLWRNHREGGREVKKTLESREVDVETGWFHICIAYIKFTVLITHILPYTSGILSYINGIQSPVNRLDGKGGGRRRFRLYYQPFRQENESLGGAEADVRAFS